MDAMALLCTLHADGPATLKRLRQAGCDSITAVRALAPSRLADLLDATPAAARRFLREADHLYERLDLGFLERESRAVGTRAPDLGAAEPPTIEDATTRASRAFEAQVGASSMSGGPARTEPPSLGHRDQRIVEQVLQAWRKRDSDEPARANESDGARSSDARASRDAGRSDDGAAEAARAVHPDQILVAQAEVAHGEVAHPEVTDGEVAHAEVQHAERVGAASIESMPGDATISRESARNAGELFPGAVDGLDQGTCLKLRAQDVYDVESLARIDALALSKTIGVGYMRLARLSALARRATIERTQTKDRARSAPRECVEHPGSHASAESSACASADLAWHARAGAALCANAEPKFSRASHPTPDRLHPLALDLEVHGTPKSPLPSKTRWSPEPATASDGGDAAGPFA
jgi:hypothetical protein